ncbi:MAG: tRNA pseudouridine(13) synthase TruD [Thermofilum sp.]
MPLRCSVPLDIALGMEYYGLETPGSGGFLRRELGDFLVFEVSVDGAVASPRCGDEGGSGEYTWLVMEKRKVDTLTAVRAIEKFFGLPKGSVGVAGLKDTTAITYQFVSVPLELDPVKVEEFNSKHSRVKLHCFFRRPFRLRPGLLFGNRFEVVIRDVRNVDAAAEAVQHLKQVGGLPNYYGYQRFGSVRPITHIVGKHILLGEYELAVEKLLLTVYEKESERAKRVRRYLAETGDYKGTLSMFPRTMHNEKAVIAYLAEHPGDYVGAFRALSTYVRKLFIGAYQAYLFNRLLSRRIEEGLSFVYAVPGDIVGFFSDRKTHEPSGVLLVNSAVVDKVNRWISEGHAALLLPIFGYNSQLPSGKPGELARELLREEGLDLAAFRLKSMPEASSGGTYRLAALKPLEVSYAAEGSTVRLVFTLRKGMYATTLLRDIVKPEDPPAQGF